MGFLGVRFEVGGNINPCLKPVKIMLDTSNLARKYTPICSLRKYTLYCLGPLNFADVSIFLQRNSVFCPKKYLDSKQWCESCVRDFLVLFSVFVRQQVTITENITFADYVSGIRPPDFSKLAKNPKNNNDVTIFWHDLNVKFFWRCIVSLVKFSYWSRFHVNIITGSGIMTIFFYKGLTRNLEIGNNPVWVLPNIWRLGRVMDTNLARMSQIECYWILQNSRVTTFTIFELLRENQLEGKIAPSSPAQIRVIIEIFQAKLKHSLLNASNFFEFLIFYNFWK